MLSEGLYDSPLKIVVYVIHIPTNLRVALHRHHPSDLVKILSFIEQTQSGVNYLTS